MATTDAVPLKWSAQFTVSPSPRCQGLPGDKILLPASALEQLLSAASAANPPSPQQQHRTYYDNPYAYAAQRQVESQFADRQQQLPHPLTFRLVNPENGRVVYAGIREFSAEDGEVVLSEFLRQALGLKGESRDGSPIVDGAYTPHKSDDAMELDNETSGSQITIHAKQLEKGTYVKLRPMEAGYDPEDWKALLEQHLRSNYTTLTNGEVLVVPGGRGVGGKREEFRFLIDGFKPEADAICVVDTDLEVDIEALNEEQARETLKRIAAKMQKAPGTDQGSSMGDDLDLFSAQHGQVLPGEYVDYQLPSWPRTEGLEFELDGLDEEDDVDLLISPFSARQRARPRLDEHVFADFNSRSSKRIGLEATNVELEDAEALWVSVHAFSPGEMSTQSAAAEGNASSLRHFTIRAKIAGLKSNSNDASENSQAPPNPEDVRCQNCHQWVPKRTLVLHENFCLRNNVACSQGCGQVFQKRSDAFARHWHCAHDTFYGNTTTSHEKHDFSHHRTTICPSKTILCRFCHLAVPQEGDPDVPNPEALLSGLTPHELADGSRTTECHLCGKITRLRDMSTHLKHHDLERKTRSRPRICRNANCGRTLDGCNHAGDTRAGTRMGQGPGNDVGLCSTCFGPLYVSMYDPEGKALKRRIERRYLQQLLTGCGKSWCRNAYCKTGRKNTGVGDASVSTKDALPLVKPFVEGAVQKGGESPLHFCVDEGSQKRRGLAEMLAAEAGVGGSGGYDLEWCVGALEAEGGDLDKARSWLANWAPTRSEERR
ncbi:hypothetical protein H2203_000814 [Taxawa tesnikishii (nom. ined.)]|nr:hypothetical protein H2203_000814 [Dothideales sp. JES 119]